MIMKHSYQNYLLNTEYAPLMIVKNHKNSASIERKYIFSQAYCSSVSDRLLDLWPEIRLLYIVFLWLAASHSASLQ